MAETCTITEIKEHRGLSKIVYEFTTSSDGSCTGETLGDYSGLIYYVISDPGSTAPTAAWDFQLQDEDDYDVLNGAGADRSATSTEYLQASSNGLGVVMQNKLTLEVTNGGSGKNGKVVVYVVD
jgi:hypothetical protein